MRDRAKWIADVSVQKSWKKANPLISLSTSKELTEIQDALETISNHFNIEFRGLDKDELQKSMMDDDKHKYCFEFTKEGLDLPKSMQDGDSGSKPH